MKGRIVYLDSSTIIKRYIKEPGSDYVRETYLKCYSGDITLSFSIWNIGEVLGAFDKARTIGRIDAETYAIVKRRFLLEVRRMARLGSLLIVPLKTRILKDSWKLIERHHIYEADALQIISAKYVNSAEFLTGDRRLHEVALKEGLKSRYLG